MTAVIQPKQLGVCSWSLQPGDSEALVSALDRLEIDVVQLALVPLVEESGPWGNAIEQLRDSGVRIASGMLEAVGEDYSTLETIRRTGGVLPEEHWPQTHARAREVAALAGDAGIDLVTLHAGFVPHDADDPQRATVLERLRILGDLFGGFGVRVGLETGQENAATLWSALEELDHENVGVNFDPANMILYGMGDPVEAIRSLGPKVVQVHAKDALPTEEPGTWGSEVPLGSGVVNWDAFLAEVSNLPVVPDIMIEREAGDARETDIAQARDRLLGRSLARD